MITLTGREFAAADLQEDQIINSFDLIKLRRILLGIEWGVQSCIELLNI